MCNCFSRKELVCIFLFIITLVCLRFAVVNYKLELSESLSMMLTIAVIISAFVAYFQLKKHNDTAWANLLMKIETRYGSGEILEARILIHKIYRKARDGEKGICDEVVMKKIHKEIHNIGKDINRSNEFILLLNFLDFLETISFYTKKGYVNDKDINEMFGGNLPYWHDVYSGWICYRRTKFKDPEMYCELESLARKIRGLKT